MFSLLKPISLRVFLFTIIVSLLSSTAFTQDKCESLFFKQAQSQTSLQKIKLNLSNFMLRFKPQPIDDSMAVNLFGSVKNLLADTTGKRVENKVTANTEIVSKAIEKFRKNISALNLELIDRDLQIQGERNVTYTEYTQPFAVNFATLKRSGFEVRDELKNNLQQMTNVKIRIRSYGLVSSALANFGIGDIKFPEFTRERAFVELKFKDPSFDGAVFKPQAYMKKEYTELFGSKEFLTKFAEIKADTLAHLQISSKKTLDQTSVENMLEFLRHAHLKKFSLSIVAINIYERSAKSLVLKYDAAKDLEFNPAFGKVESVELQMTFDQLISLYLPGKEINLGENQYYNAYDPTQTVSEFKTPTIIAHHLKRAQDEAKRLGREGLVVSDAQAKLLNQIIPGLKEYFEMMNEIMQARDEAKALDSGKWGIAIKKIKSDIEDYLNKLYMNDYDVVH